MSDFHPLVSIIIPVYNGENYLKCAIDSALAQTYDNCEVIVINDGSSDGGATDRIARSYGDKIRYFSKENGGVATALNLGIREMQGQYFSWLSHDDVYMPDKIGKQIDFMREFELQDAVLYSDFCWIDGRGHHMRDAYLLGVPPEKFLQYLYLDQVGVHGCTLLIPHEAFYNVGMFQEDLKTTQDYDLWMRMCRKHPFVHQAEILISSRVHAQQGSKTIKSHRGETRSLYQRYLRDLMVAFIKDKTGTEAARQRLRIAERFYRRGLVLQAESLCEFAESHEEIKAIRRLHLKFTIKQIFLPFWKRLPKYVKKYIKTSFLNKVLCNNNMGNYLEI
jgi:glycosyltransferase involved in cell wall biosynthesis